MNEATTKCLTPTESELNAELRVFGTHQELVYGSEGYAPPPFVTDHTQAVIQKMTAMRIEQAIMHSVMVDTLEDMASRMTQSGRGLLADRMDLAADGVSQLALMGWHGHMRFGLGRGEKPMQREPLARDLWNGDEGTMH